MPLYTECCALLQELRIEYSSNPTALRQIKLWAATLARETVDIELARLRCLEAGVELSVEDVADASAAHF
ncbi:hypothetical protein DB347_20845 [Opitutaceae bacterium EW11]|nr:hypothetical protein DB347_20845 [Opitutaceae bacterium EW11]